MKKNYWMCGLATLSFLCCLGAFTGCGGPNAGTTPAETATPAPAVQETAAPTPEPTAVPTADPSAVTADTALEKLSVSAAADCLPVYTVQNGAALKLNACSFDQSDHSEAGSDGTVLLVEDGSAGLYGCTLSTGADGVCYLVVTGGSKLSVADSVFVASGADTILVSVGEECAAEVTGSMISVCGAGETAFLLENASALALSGTTVETGEDAEATLIALCSASANAEQCTLNGSVSASGDGCSLTLDRSEWNGTLTADSEDGDIRLTLKNISVFTGTLSEECAGGEVSLDLTSRWNLTADCTIGALADEDTTLANISGNGFNLYYNSELAANAWLESRTIGLADGGYLIPLI